MTTREAPDPVPVLSPVDESTRIVIEAVPGLFWSSRPDGSIEFLNEGWARFTGLDREEVTDWGWIASRMIHPDDASALSDVWLEIMRSRREGQLEARLKRADGQYHWFLFQARPHLDGGGTVLRWLGAGIDIHERKRAQELLDAERRILELISRGESLTTILTGICHLVERLSSCSLTSILLYDPRDGYLRHAAAPSLPRGYVEAMGVIEVGPDQGSCGTAAYRREPVIVTDIAADPLWTCRRDIPLQHGLRACWSSPILAASGDLLGTFAILSREPREPEPFDHKIIDQITHLASIAIERTRAREALRLSESQLTEAQQLSLTGNFTWAPSTGEITWSSQTYRIYEVDPLVNPSLGIARERIHPDDRSLYDEQVRRGIETGQALTFEHRLLMPGGAVKHLRVVARPEHDGNGGYHQYFGAVMDITERRSAEEKIRQNEREFREIIDAIPQLISVVSTTGDILYSNKRVLALFGLSQEQVQAGELVERMHPEDRASLRGEINGAVTKSDPFDVEYRMLMPNGEYRWFLNQFIPLLDENGASVRWYVTGLDIDDRKRNEDQVRNENLMLREEIARSFLFEEIIGSSAKLKAVISRVSKVSPTDSTVLITGETGTGKELVARAIHKNSPRSRRAFVSVNCAAFSRSLIASELFGHEKGAFTGATQRRLGRFELAQGGTIFLDEIGELPPETQIALLRVIQEREFERVGGNQTLKTDVRIVAATHQDLQALIDAGAFRSDLYYRLNVFPIEVPPLRERREDIPLLVAHFVHHYATRARKKIEDVDRRTMERLRNYDWPGNVRELQNVIERSVVICETPTLMIDEQWIAPSPASASLSPKPLPRKVSGVERNMIEEALAESRGRVSGPRGAAARLGVPASTLESKIRSLRIDKHRFKTI